MTAAPGAVTTSRAARRTAPERRIDHPIQEVTMKAMCTGWCLAVAALAVGCSENPTGPYPSAEPNLKVEHEEFTVEYVWDYVAPFACTDELMHVRGILVVDKYRLWNPVQNPNRKGPAVDYKGLNAEYPEFSMEGVESGDMWILDVNKSKWGEKKHVFVDGDWVYHQDLNWWFERADGERLHVQGTYQLIKKDGAVTLYQVARGSCPEVW